ncbi:MAG: Fur family transcriptional regulator [Bacteroidales bacterium]
MKLSNEAQQRLIEFGIKPSVQRIAIMDYLLTHKTHPTVDDIYMELVAFIPTLSRTTVYNTLGLFVENGAALCLGIEQKNARYDGDISNHAHFLCKNCGELEDVHDFADTNFISAMPRGFQVTEVHVYYKGYCSKCQDQSQTNC